MEITQEIRKRGLRSYDRRRMGLGRLPAVFSAVLQERRSRPSHDLSQRAARSLILLSANLFPCQERRDLDHLELSTFLRIKINAPVSGLTGSGPTNRSGNFIRVTARFLRRNSVEINAIDELDEERIEKEMENDLRDQIAHNIKRGVLKQTAAGDVKYSWRGMIYLWCQFFARPGEAVTGQIFRFRRDQTFMISASLCLRWSSIDLTETVSQFLNRVFGIAQFVFADAAGCFSTSSGVVQGRPAICAHAHPCVFCHFLA